MGQTKAIVRSTAEVDALYAQGHNAYEYVYAMPNIKEIEVLETTADRKLSRARWVLDVPLPGEFGKLAWIKSATWDDSQKTCVIALDPEYDGVVKKLTGLWEFRPAKAGSEMMFTMDFIIEHPLVNPFVHRIFDGLFKKNFEALMREVKKKAEAAG